MVDFPEELLWSVLGYLPITTLLYFCSVSKKWSSFVKDPQFQRHWASINGGDQSLFYLEFLKHVSAKTDYLFFTVFEGYLHLRNLKLSSDDHYVVDPTIAYVKKIPYLPCDRSFDSTGRTRYKEQHVGMVVNPWRRNYSVFRTSRRYFVRGRPSKKQLVNVYQYDSSKDAWHVACIFCSRIEGWKRQLTGVVIHQGSLHFLVASQRDNYLRDSFLQVVRYEEQKKDWECLTNGFPPLGHVYGCQSPPLLFVHKEKLLLAALLLNRYVIWQYNNDMAKWDVWVSFPEEFTHLDSMADWGGRSGFRAQCCGDFLYVTKWPTVMGQPGVYASVKNVTPSAMVCNLENKMYKEMPYNEVDSPVDSTVVVRFSDWSDKFFFQPAHWNYSHSVIDCSIYN